MKLLKKLEARNSRRSGTRVTVLSMGKTITLIQRLKKAFGLNRSTLNAIMKMAVVMSHSERVGERERERGSGRD